VAGSATAIDLGEVADWQPPVRSARSRRSALIAAVRTALIAAMLFGLSGAALPGSAQPRRPATKSGRLFFAGGNVIVVPAEQTRGSGIGAHRQRDGVRRWTWPAVAGAYWGRAAIVDGALLVEVLPPIAGIPEPVLTALDAASGEPLWTRIGGLGGYSATTVVVATNAGYVAVAARTGRFRWSGSAVPEPVRSA
jgi:outer membrane protein assembly factor BamB